MRVREIEVNVWICGCELDSLLVGFKCSGSFSLIKVILPCVHEPHEISGRFHRSVTLLLATAVHTASKERERKH